MTVPRGRPIGGYYLIACADGWKVVSESDEGNNCATLSTQIEITP